VRLGLLTAGVLAVSVAAQPAPDIERALDELLKPHLSNVPGLSIAMVDGGRLRFARGFGTISITSTIPPTPDTQYRLASVSKPFTAAAIFRLVEDGKLELDQPARQYCPELAPLDGTPTVRHFLTHQSGMRHTTDSEDTSNKGPVPRLGAALQKIVHEPLRFVPGSKTLYTSWGYTVLGCIIETVSGQTYEEFLKARIFAPAGLTATTFDRPDYASPNFSPGFRRGTVYGFRPSIVVDTRFKTPASGLISTVNDLTRFATAFLDGRLVADSFVKQMLTIDRGGEEGRLRFTPGWTPAGMTKEGPAFDFNGSMEGTTAILDMVPARRYALALLANRERYVPELLPMVREVRRLVLESPPGR
jgi:serine beta-lactamase-like protein LACTB, mitochondrial